MNSFSLGIASDGTGAMLQRHYIIIGSSGSKNERLCEEIRGHSPIAEVRLILRTSFESEGVVVASWAERLVSELDAADEAARALTEGLTAEQLNWQPAAGVWSVGQCLEHLSIFNELYLPPIAKALAGKAKGAVEEITPGWFGRFFIHNFVEPSTSQKKAGAPKKIVPGSRVEISVVDRFAASNRLAREVIRQAREYNVNQIRFRNPLIPAIWFTTGTGLEIVSGHERRHLLQAQRVKTSAGFPRHSS